MKKHTIARLIGFALIALAIALCIILVTAGCYVTTDAEKYQYDKRWGKNFDEQYPKAMNLWEIQQKEKREKEIIEACDRWYRERKEQHRWDILQIVKDWILDKLWILVGSGGVGAGGLIGYGVHRKHKQEQKTEHRFQEVQKTVMRKINGGERGSEHEV